MELVGTIIAVLPAQSGVSQRTGNPWMSQDYVLEVPGQYPRRCTFRIFGEDRIKQFAIQQGEQNLTVYFDIDAHEYNGRWFNEIKAYNIARAGQQASAPASASQATSQATAAPAQATQPEMFPATENPEDLPF